MMGSSAYDVGAGLAPAFRRPSLRLKFTLIDQATLLQMSNVQNINALFQPRRTTVLLLSDANLHSKEVSSPVGTGLVPVPTKSFFVRKLIQKLLQAPLWFLHFSPVTYRSKYSLIVLFGSSLTGPPLLV